MKWTSYAYPRHSRVDEPNKPAGIAILFTACMQSRGKEVRHRSLTMCTCSMTCSVLVQSSAWAIHRKRIVGDAASQMPVHGYPMNFQRISSLVSQALEDLQFIKPRSRCLDSDTQPQRVLFPVATLYFTQGY